MLKEILEMQKCNMKEEIKKLKSILDDREFQVFKNIILDRCRTNFDSRWEKEYFYGDLRDKSREDAKWLNQVYAKAKLKCSEDDFCRFFLDGVDPKVYFKNMK
jgi:hypothetical protein